MTIQKIQLRVSFLCGEEEYFSIDELAEDIRIGLATQKIVSINGPTAHFDENGKIQSEFPIREEGTNYPMNTPYIGIVKESIIANQGRIAKPKRGRPRKKK